MSQYDMEPTKRPYGCAKLLRDITIGMFVLALLCSGLFGFMQLFPDFGEVLARVQPAPTRVPTATPAPTPTPDPLAYSTICAPRGSEMTTPQRERYVAQFVNQPATDWDGWVYDVVAVNDLFDTYDSGESWKVLIAMEPRGLMWSRDLEVYGLPDELTESLVIEQPVRVSGRIAEIGVFMEGMCNPVYVVDATLTLR